MTTDVHLLVGAYAVGALDADEEREFAEHLASCPACTAELPWLLETAARLGAAEAVTPPPALRSRVLATAAETRQLPPQVTALRPRTSGRLRSALLAAAAVTVLAGAAGVTWQTRELVREAEVARTATIALAEALAAPDADVTTAEAAPGGRGVIVRSASGGQAVFLAAGLPDLPEDRVYQVWYVGTGDPVSAGLLDPEVAAQVLDPAPGTALVAVTEEPAGGSPAPTGDPLVAVPLET